MALPASSLRGKPGTTRGGDNTDADVYWNQDMEPSSICTSVPSVVHELQQDNGNRSTTLEVRIAQTAVASNYMSTGVLGGNKYFPCCISFVRCGSRSAGWEYMFPCCFLLSMSSGEENSTGYLPRSAIRALCGFGRWDTGSLVFGVILVILGYFPTATPWLIGLSA